MVARVRPDLWETAGEADDLAMQDLAHPHLSDGLGRGLLSERLLGRPDLVQGRFPAALEFRGDETIVGIDVVELPFGQSGGVALALELTFRTGAQRRIHLLLGSARPRQRIKLGRRQRCQERVRHDRVDARGADVLAGRQAFVGAQMIAYILLRRPCSGRTSCDRIARTRRCRAAEDRRRGERLSSWCACIRPGCLL